MRYSNQAPIEPETPVSTSASNLEFFASVRRSVGEARLAGAVLLVGGSDERALSVRRAQAVLRYDRLVSYWSHAALIVAGRPGSAARGIEVTIDPHDAHLQRPGRNGATVFSLDRYADSARYPNLGLFCAEFPPGSPARQTIIEAALDPNRDRTRYPFWDQLATWARYAYAPDVAPNPLLEGVALPGAAFCEYVYGAAHIDLTPGATGNHACPEVLWATMKRWAPALDAMDAIEFKAFTVLRDPGATPAPQPPSLAVELGLADATRSLARPERATIAKTKSRTKPTRQAKPSR